MQKQTNLKKISISSKDFKFKKNYISSKDFNLEKNYISSKDFNLKKKKGVKYIPSRIKIIARKVLKLKYPNVRKYWLLVKKVFKRAVV